MCVFMQRRQAKEIIYLTLLSANCNILIPMSYKQKNILKCFMCVYCNVPTCILRQYKCICRAMRSASMYIYSQLSKLFSYRERRVHLYKTIAIYIKQIDGYFTLPKKNLFYLSKKDQLPTLILSRKLKYLFKFFFLLAELLLTTIYYIAHKRFSLAICVALLFC